MYKLLIAAAMCIFAAGPALATEQTDAMAPVHQFIDGFNKGDVKSALAACAEQTSIIDEFPPHEWHGAGACAKWLSDFDVDAKKNGITDGVVTLGDSLHVDINSDYAYVVVPANYRFKQKGKTVSEVGSIITLSLKNGPMGWRITGWAWAKH